MRSSIHLLVVIAVFGTAGVARAQDEAQVQDWPRFHIGGAVSESNLLVWDWADSGLPERFWGNDSVESGTAWKIAASFRPVRIVGVEFQFIDFGEGTERATSGWSLGGGQVPTNRERSSSLNASAEARVLSALLFVPEQLPLIDVYGKIGIADLDESIIANATEYVCTPLSICRSDFSSELRQSDVGPYVGFGARIKVGAAAGVRAELEAVDRDGGDPMTFLSVGIAWEH